MRLSSSVRASLNTTGRTRPARIAGKPTAMTITEIPTPGSAVQSTGLVEQTEHHYRRCGWPVLVDGMTITVRTGEGLDAIVMCASLGASVAQRLNVLLMPTPVIVYRAAPRSWLFVTGPATPVRATTVADVAAAGVSLIRSGTPLVLPFLGGPSDAARWLDAPGPSRRVAPWQAVVSTVRAIASDGTCVA